MFCWIALSTYYLILNFDHRAASVPPQGVRLQCPAIPANLTMETEDEETFSDGGETETSEAESWSSRSLPAIRDYLLSRKERA